VRWVTVTGDGDEDEQVETSETVTIPSGEAVVALVFIHSEEYPTFTSVASQYDDMLYWNVSAGDGYPVLTRAVHVNEEEIAWEEGESEGFDAFGFSPVAPACGAVYFAGGVDLEISVTLRAINVGDGILPSSVIVGFFPILVTQANMPTPCDVETTTDAGTSYFRARIPTNGVAYITGQPAAPSLTARIRGLPEWIPVDWGGTLVSERGDKRTGGIDDRTLGPQEKYGEEEYNITGALNGEIIGGRVTLNAAVSDLAGFAYRFSIRGKNPRDAAAKAYIDSCVPQETVPYAWRIACHESKDGDRFYNQFNAQETGLKELPNWGSPHGWGIAQIDKGENGDSTAEVYDWHENVASMRAKLIYAIGRTDAFLGYYRSAYSNTSNWSEPPSTNINGYVILPRTWSILTIYNDVDGIPAQTTPYHSGKFHSPLQFIPSEGRWIFHTNSINPNYVKQVFEDSSLQEGNGVE
ncbi:MAG: hypothetical protein IKR48_13415, partial [Kiritimatiellae bacterium]|nr:hypothetical protein [Kiritimatiellia bacterium]